MKTRTVKQEQGNIKKGYILAIQKMTLALATMVNCRNRLEYPFILGKLLALFTEIRPTKTGMNIDEDIDNRIMKSLKNLPLQEKVNLAAFLLGLENPMSLAAIEHYIKDVM